MLNPELKIQFPLFCIAGFCKILVFHRKQVNNAFQHTAEAVL